MARPTLLVLLAIVLALFSPTVLAELEPEATALAAPEDEPAPLTLAAPEDEPAPLTLAAPGSERGASVPLLALAAT